MKGANIYRFLAVQMVLIVCAAAWAEGAGLGTGWTYQGRLIDNNEPADGAYDLQFSLWSDPCEVNETYRIGDDVNAADWEVMDGYFTVLLDFNDPCVFDGSARWLEIGVRPGDSNDVNDFVTLSPRQEVTPAPHAIYADSSKWINLIDIPADINDGDDVGITSETDPTVLASVKDGISWSEVSSRPAGLDDGDDVGITSETDPTVLASVKDGVSWSEVSNRPAGLDDGDDVGITSETDPQVGSNDPNYIPKWNGSALVSGTIYDNGNVGIGTTSPDAKLEVDGDLKVTGAYKGNISSSSGSDGAPFPRPAYDSGWVSISQGEGKTLTHNIGGNVDNYVVDMQFIHTGSGDIGIIYIGGHQDGAYFRGAYWRFLTSSSILVGRMSNDSYVDQVRIRIWVYN